MELLQNYGKELVSLCVPLITWALNTFVKGKARLVQGSPHTFHFLIEQPLLDAKGVQISPTQSMKTRSLLVANTGKETATNVELVFNWKPPYLNVWPPRHYQELTAPDKRHVLKFSSMAPNEFIACELFVINGEIPELVIVRSDQCVAENIEMLPQQVFPLWQRRLAVVLLMMGLGTAVYLSIVLLQFLVLKTPLGR